MLDGFMTKAACRDWYALLLPELSHEIAPGGMILCVLNIASIILTPATFSAEFMTTVLLSASTILPPYHHSRFITLSVVSSTSPRHIPKANRRGGDWIFLLVSANSSHVLRYSRLARS